MRNLSERTDLTPELWDTLIDADPPFFVGWVEWFEEDAFTYHC